jgi:D-amino-acid oxidase
MNRRQLLLAGLASTVPGVAHAAALPPVKVERARIVRTTVGLRPFRPAGPRIEAEWIDRKLIVHHYGHGGAGMSLAWGTGRRAARLAAAHSPARRAAVLGAGVVGLCTALQLQRLGFAVTLYASELPHETTSALSLATWSPSSSLVDEVHVDAAFETEFRAAAAIALGELHRHATGRYGIAWRDTYTLRDRPPGAGLYGLHALAPPIAEREVLVHPFPHRYVAVRPTLRIAPVLYLTALLADVRAAGGRLILRTFGGVEEVLALREPVIMNCTGLGAGPLFGDATLVPIKGQLTLLSPQPEVRYCLSSISSEHGSFYYMIPRPDGIVLGGTAEYGDATLDVDDGAVERILQVHRSIWDPG